MINKSVIAKHFIHKYMWWVYNVIIRRYFPTYKAHRPTKQRFTLTEYWVRIWYNRLCFSIIPEYFYRPLSTFDAYFIVHQIYGRSRIIETYVVFRDKLGIRCRTASEERTRDRCVLYITSLTDSRARVPKSTRQSPRIYDYFPKVSSDTKETILSTSKLLLQIFKIINHVRS